MGSFKSMQTAMKILTHLLHQRYNAKMRLKLIIIFTVFSIIVGTFTGGYLAISRGIPSIEEMKQYKPETGTKIYADDDVLIGELKVEKGIFVPINKIPEHMINSVIAVEDSRFWRHKGIDYLAIARAVIKDILYVGLKEGGSTITQQLAKVMFLTPEKTLKRKLREAALAIKIEKSLDKKEILELYLNKIYFGHGAYGVEMASRIYFGKSVKDITLPEAALIAGLIKAPSLYSPYNDLTKAKERQQIVLSRMEEEGFIKMSEKDDALKQPVYLSSMRKGIEANNYFIEYVRKYLEEKYGEETVYKEGLKVYTTLDRKAQLSGAKALQEGLKELDKRRGWRGPLEHKKDIDIEREMKSKEFTTSVVTTPGYSASGLVLKVSNTEALIKTRGIMGKLSIGDARWASNVIGLKKGTGKVLKDFKLTQILKPGDIVKVSIKSIRGSDVRLSLEQEPEVEGALVALEPDTGFIRAIVGGYDFVKSDFNRALYAKRQPGSAFKPIIYAAALDHGFTPASTIVDEPITYHGGPKGEWSPENYDHKFYGPTRLREALTYSRNVVTVKLVEALGVNNVIDFARTIGIQGDIPTDLTLALGSLSISPLDLALCYTVFASNGMKVKPVAIKYITDSRGRVLESNEPEAEEVISPQTAFLITSMMEDVVRNGTGWRAKALGRPVAGKTGTTNEYRDAWFVGYTPDLVSAVWVGFDDMRPLGHLETGARAASPIWVSFMKDFLSGEIEDFTVPEGIVSYTIDPATGLLSKDESIGVKEYFEEGTEPKKFAPSTSIREPKENPVNLNFD
ncbi:MAG: penicillin-binding protein [Nitrospirae bacterium CG_4_10_14_0_8_um_filter_41_23]|nr:MAG: penicillin-binding protein [Nitrospirae bacterium CG11_big_fil_rev_8_21_14_0_20_41_14]PIV42128.1 MAG: penicillin-binding protein [Nitrospirae bacterium CG02_land_8_20_14_3_00_41_53]PIW86425.1 MAG: penicillin-binding protein [Nitrospirae bacterium CG_4_8_14_3_um_filter_41_47]PIY87876.1 MAG: penicillin-binding protein [Nitrospirae bacterium CG_4_10_14_0_8_um_filter_41_23]PJA80292.1 MAG: penicillin-binding protein [Nitrospirae bacterium CG_4_9_14_3_um_filter_41_27]